MGQVEDTAIELKTQAEELQISSDEMQEYASVLLNSLRDLEKEIKGTFAPIKKQQDLAKKETLAQEKKALNPVVAAMSLIRSKMERYHSQKLAEARERARAEAEAAAKAAGKEKEEIIEIPVTVSSPTGVSFRDTWKYEITNPAEIPREYLIPDEKKIGSEVRSRKGDFKVPGVRVWKETTSVAR